MYVRTDGAPHSSTVVARYVRATHVRTPSCLCVQAGVKKGWLSTDYPHYACCRHKRQLYFGGVVVARTSRSRIFSDDTIDLMCALGPGWSVAFGHLESRPSYCCNSITSVGYRIEHLDTLKYRTFRYVVSEVSVYRYIGFPISDFRFIESIYRIFDVSYNITGYTVQIWIRYCWPSGLSAPQRFLGLFCCVVRASAR